jgi:hypothetical protein
MSINHVIASIKKETKTINDNQEQILILDSSFVEISNNLFVNNDCSLNNNTTISNEIILMELLMLN